jgi:gluconolactonase
MLCMKLNRAYWLSGALTAIALVLGQANAQTQSETTTPGIPGVVSAGTVVQLIREGFQGTEGAISAPDGSLLFAEWEAGRVVKIGNDGTISTYLENTNRTVGLAYDPKGRLVGAAMATPQVSVLLPNRVVLADQFEGRPFGLPNDLVIDRKGGVYFTDTAPAFREDVPSYTGAKPALYYIKPGGELVRLTEDVERPNGIQLSPDEAILYATSADGIVAFDVNPDGTVRNRRIFATLAGTTRTPKGIQGAADGIAVDAEGRLYAATGIGVQVFSSEGKALGTIPTPRPAQNLAFAGPAKKTLFVVGRGAAYKISMLAQGLSHRAK